MSSKLITLALVFSTGCHFAAEGYVAEGRGDVLQDNHHGHEEEEDTSLFDQDHQNGHGPILVDTYTECWRLPEGGYGWYFDATVEHTSGGKYVDQIESVWVDIYFGNRNITFELYDEVTLNYPLDAPGAEIFDYQTMYDDGVWMRSEYENTTALDCNSSTAYDIYTTAYDYEGNYQTVVEYL